MKVSLNWLRRHVDLPESAEDVAKALTSIGLEVEGMEEPGKVYDKLLVAKVLTCDPHPDSDHLHITTVNDGTNTIQVVCGAPNVAAGQTVVLAPIGAELPLPDGTKLKMKFVMSTTLLMLFMPTACKSLASQAGDLSTFTSLMTRPT